ncbi:hypothetical protein VB713_08700 [Anabaena cylindrica UHCC 0172]|nr:hypothetical protein [Anabaena cylindrica]MEA5551055.1 hypothetical protein [Anabaena cylindrica UHCC 0172]
MNVSDSDQQGDIGVYAVGLKVTQRQVTKDLTTPKYYIANT